MTPKELDSLLKSLAGLRDSMTGEERAQMIAVLSAAREKLLTPMQAAAQSPKNERTVRMLEAKLRRHGYEMVADEKINLTKLNECLSASRASTDVRFSLKSELASIGLIS